MIVEQGVYMEELLNGTVTVRVGVYRSGSSDHRAVSLP